MIQHSSSEYLITLTVRMHSLLLVAFQASSADVAANSNEPRSWLVQERAGLMLTARHQKARARPLLLRCCEAGMPQS